MPMKLADLLREFPYPYRLLNGDVEITGLAADSRQVQPGYLFVAIAGGSTDGHDYIPAALERGAVAIAGTKPVGELKLPYLLLEDSRMGLPHLSAAFFSYPARHLTMIAVTGTDGKTTTT